MFGGQSMTHLVSTTEILQHYSVGSEIGSGASATVYSVIDNRTQKPYVMKVISTMGLTEEEKSNVRVEVEALKKANHPNIIMHHESDINACNCVILMEKCETTLETVIDSARLFVENQQKELALSTSSSAGDDGLASSQSKVNRHRPVPKLSSPFPEELLIEWMAELLSALQYLHTNRIVHRDIKTGNIFVSRKNHLKLGDFGVCTILASAPSLAENSEETTKRKTHESIDREDDAGRSPSPSPSKEDRSVTDATSGSPSRAASPRATSSVSYALHGGVGAATYSFVGTPFYIAPEVCLGDQWTPQSDVWSLGIVLYELCTLKRPFDGNNIMHLVEAITEGPIPPFPSGHLKDSRFEMIVLSMLNRDPAKRPTVKTLLEKYFVLPASHPSHPLMDPAKARDVQYHHGPKLSFPIVEPTYFGGGGNDSYVQGGCMSIGARGNPAGGNCSVHGGDASQQRGWLTPRSGASNAGNGIATEEVVTVPKKVAEGTGSKLTDGGRTPPPITTLQRQANGSAAPPARGTVTSANALPPKIARAKSPVVNSKTGGVRLRGLSGSRAALHSPLTPSSVFAAGAFSNMRNGGSVLSGAQAGTPNRVSPQHKDPMSQPGTPKHPYHLPSSYQQASHAAQHQHSEAFKQRIKNAKSTVDIGSLRKQMMAKHKEDLALQRQQSNDVFYYSNSKMDEDVMVVEHVEKKGATNSRPSRGSSPLPANRRPPSVTANHQQHVDPTRLILNEDHGEERQRPSSAPPLNLNASAPRRRSSSAASASAGLHHDEDKHASTHRTFRAASNHAGETDYIVTPHGKFGITPDGPTPIVPKKASTFIANDTTVISDDSDDGLDLEGTPHYDMNAVYVECGGKDLISSPPAQDSLEKAGPTTGVTQDAEACVVSPSDVDVEIVHTEDSSVQHGLSPQRAAPPPPNPVSENPLASVLNVLKDHAEELSLHDLDEIALTLNRIRVKRFGMY